MRHAQVIQPCNWQTPECETQQAGCLLGEQIFGTLGKAPPPLLNQMHDNKLLTVGAIYGLDVIAQTAKSINAFEITYNGQLLHSKLKTGQFPELSAIAAKLKSVMDAEGTKAEAAEGAEL